MRSIIYINAPFEKPEHDAIEKAARTEGRSKGQQLRHFALKALNLPDSPIQSPKRPAKAR